MLTGFPRTRWLRLRFSESYAVRISVKISRICEFRVIMGIMTGLLGCCSSSTLGSRANDYVKTLATLGFWLHHSPCSLGCWTNNTLAARSLSPKPLQWWVPGSTSTSVHVWWRQTRVLNAPLFLRITNPCCLLILFSLGPIHTQWLIHSYCSPVSHRPGWTDLSSCIALCPNRHITQ